VVKYKIIRRIMILCPKVFAKKSYIENYKYNLTSKILTFYLVLKIEP